MEYGITRWGNPTERKRFSATKENNQNYGSETRTSCRPFFQSLQILALPSQYSYIQSLMKFLSRIRKIYTLNITVHGINKINKPQLHKPAAIPDGNIHVIQCVPLATELGISLIIVTSMKTLQLNLNRSTFVVWEMKRNVSVVSFKFRCNILISGKIIKEMPGSVASGTHCIWIQRSLTSCLNTLYY